MFGAVVGGGIETFGVDDAAGQGDIDVPAEDSVGVATRVSSGDWTGGKGGFASVKDVAFADGATLCPEFVEVATATADVGHWCGLGSTMGR